MNRLIILGLILLIIISLFTLLNNNNKNKNKIIEGFGIDTLPINQYTHYVTNVVCQNTTNNITSVNNKQIATLNSNIPFNFSNANFSPLFMVPSLYNPAILSNILQSTNNFYNDCNNILYTKTSAGNNYKYASDENSTNVVTFVSNYTNGTFIQCLGGFIQTFILNNPEDPPQFNCFIEYNSVSNSNQGILGILKITGVTNFQKQITITNPVTQDSIINEFNSGKINGACASMATLYNIRPYRDYFYHLQHNWGSTPNNMKSYWYQYNCDNNYNKPDAVSQNASFYNNTTTSPTSISNTIIINLNSNTIKDQIIKELQNGITDVNYNLPDTNTISGITITQPTSSKPSNEYNIQIQKNDGTIEIVNNVPLRTIIYAIAVMFMSADGIMPTSGPNMDFLNSIPNINTVIHSVYKAANPNYPLFWNPVNNTSLPNGGKMTNNRFISGYINYNGNNYPAIAESQNVF